MLPNLAMSSWQDLFTISTSKWKSLDISKYWQIWSGGDGEEVGAAYLGTELSGILKYTNYRNHDQ